MKISIVITSYRRKDFIKNLIDSIFKNTRYPNYEIVVANTDPGINKGKDEYLNHMCSSGKIKLVDDGKQYQYTEGIQRGFEESDGSYIQLLNDDCLIPRSEPLWLNYLFLSIHNIGDIGSTACYQHLANMRLYTKGEFDINNPGHTHGTKMNITNLPAKSYTLWNPFSCVMMKREFLEKNQYIDIIPKEQYHYGSDSCYCRHLINSGLKNVLINNTWIYHFNDRNIRCNIQPYQYTGE